MTPAARRILEDMKAGSDLIREGIHAYCGQRRVASRTVSALVWSSAIKTETREPGCKYYSLTEMGECYLRRPELEQEYLDWVRMRKGSCTIRDDQIVPLDEPRL